MTEEIFALAKELTGAAAGEERLLRILCAAAEREVSDRLEREADPEVCQCAAAWLAAAGLMTGRAASGQGGWKVGDVSFTGGSQNSFAAAEALRQQAWRLLAGACRDSGFVFRGVKG